MTLRLLSGSAATLLLSLVAFAQVPSSLPDTPAGPQPTLALKPVPPILRLHLPILGEARGVLVESVAPGSVPERIGLQSGDVLLEAGGRGVIVGDTLEDLDASQPIVVLRRGRTRILGAGRPEASLWGGIFDAWPAPAPPTPAPMFGPRDPSLPMQGSRASSFSSSSDAGGRAVSISRAGDQISLEMSLPELAEGPIRLRGTSAEIERQLQSSTLGDAAKQEVRSVLRQAR